MRISDWSSDVCSSDLFEPARGAQAFGKRGGVLAQQAGIEHGGRGVVGGRRDYRVSRRGLPPAALCQNAASPRNRSIECPRPSLRPHRVVANPCSARSEEHTSELQSLMRISYAVFCLKKKNNRRHKTSPIYSHKYN